MAPVAVVANKTRRSVGKVKREGVGFNEKFTDGREVEVRWVGTAMAVIMITYYTA
jgi:hypothetical protein